MSTNDVPGANSVNQDVLRMGCWAEHEDGTLIHVFSTENNRVVYEMFDLSKNPPMSYKDAMIEDAFKKLFSYPPVGTSKEKFTWHDKTPFPWDRVIKVFDRPMPDIVDVQEKLTAAARIAQDLKLRAEKMKEDDIQGDKIVKKGKGILSRLGAAMAAFKE